MGDEYFANLDHIESVENFKEGYESEAHCSDSEGSGVDVSKMKVQPSALVSSNPSGRQTKKREHQSLKNNAVGAQEQKRPRSGCAFPSSILTRFFPQQLRVLPHQRTATMTTTKTRKAKKRATVQTTRSSKTATTARAPCGGVTPHAVKSKATRKVRTPHLLLGRNRGRLPPFLCWEHCDISND